MLSSLWRKGAKSKSTSTQVQQNNAQSTKKNTQRCKHQLNITSSPDHNQEQSTTQNEDPCPHCKAEKRAARIYRTKVICCLLLPYALQALDTTLIASAFPWISISFSAFSQQNWIVSAFNLTSAAFVPFWGQMADIFGRHATLQACIISMLIGSAICTAVPASPATYGAFLLGRALQGLACAGLGVVIRVVLADKVSLRDNARNTTIFTLTGGLMYGVGPVIGGALTAKDWRWCFAINLPIAFVGMVIIFFVLRGEMLGPQALPELDAQSTRQDTNIINLPRTEREGQSEGLETNSSASGCATFAKRLSTIDVGGQLFFLFGFGLLILALTWGGATYPWSHAAVLVPLVLGVVCIVCWLVWEYMLSKPEEYKLGRKLSFQRPMMPWFLLQNRNIGLLFYIQFATGMAMYCVLYFVNLYYTLVKHYTASEAGVQLLFYTPGLGVGSYLSMYMCNVYPRQTFHPLFLGSIIECVGVGMLAYALHTESSATIFGMMALTGAGTGLRFMPTSLHAIGMFPGHIASVVSLMAVALPFGGTLALTIMSTVFNNVAGVMTDGVSAGSGGGELGSGMGTTGDSNILGDLPPDTVAAITQSSKRGIVWAFVAIVPFMVVCVFAAAALGNVTVAKKRSEGLVEREEPSQTAPVDPKTGAARDGSGQEQTPEIVGGAVHIVHGPYLLSLLRKRSKGNPVKGGARDTQGLEQPAV